MSIPRKMTQTNYLNPIMFEEFTEKLGDVIEYNHSQKLGKSGIPLRGDLEMLAKIEYYCALRVSECLSLQKEDFNLKDRILTLNHTKTGFKKCKKCKGIINKYGTVCPICEKCEGHGKIRVKQFTTIPPIILYSLTNWLSLKKDGSILFPYTRQLVWNYYKKAGKLAKLDITEQQDERLIHGVWTHLLRKSYAKLMLDLGAKEVLVKVKLRHAFSVTDRYIKPDINMLKEWESKNLK
jgi:integrase